MLPSFPLEPNGFLLYLPHFSHLCLISLHLFGLSLILHVHGEASIDTPKLPLASGSQGVLKTPHSQKETWVRRPADGQEHGEKDTAAKTMCGREPGQEAVVMIST